MKAIWFTLLLLFTTNTEMPGQQIIWNKSRPLTHADFRGEPRDATSAAATSRPDLKGQVRYPGSFGWQRQINSYFKD